jgi:exodeoxyribonuclease VII small subunit
VSDRPTERSRARKGPAESLPFEEALAQLEAIIEKIEGGQVGLEQSIADYERGVALIRRCREVLKGAELRVEELTEQMRADQASRGGEPGVEAEPDLIDVDGGEPEVDDPELGG